MRSNYNVKVKAGRAESEMVWQECSQAVRPFLAILRTRFQSLGFACVI